MGLTIHYYLKARGNDAAARKLITALHQAAQDLPFQELGDIIDLSGDACDFQARELGDPLRWLLCQAEGSVELTANRSMRVKPTRVICFTAWPGEGCEESNIGLCRYPRSISHAEFGIVKTRLSGWRWRSFCKTQYASNPDCGGVPHFLRCHLAVTALLDQAQKLGVLDEVHDEGHFWETRDVPALVNEIGSWNEMIAAFGGKLKDLLGDSGLAWQSAISEFPNFEHLAAAGQTKLPPGTEALARLIQRVAHEKPA